MQLYDSMLPTDLPYVHSNGCSAVCIELRTALRLYMASSSSLGIEKSASIAVVVYSFSSIQFHSTVFPFLSSCFNKCCTRVSFELILPLLKF